jgi:hypothetical protein
VGKRTREYKPYFNKLKYVNKQNKFRCINKRDFSDLTLKCNYMLLTRVKRDGIQYTSQILIKRKWQKLKKKKKPIR